MSDHRCRADSACVAITPDGAALTTKPSTICRSCVNRLQAQLDELPEIREVLTIYIRKSIVAQAGGAKVSSSPEPSTPINLHALDVIDELDDVLFRCGGLRIVDLINRPSEQFTVLTVGGSRVKYLDGVDRALGVSRVWKKADGIIGISRAWQRHLARCPKCDLQTLGSFAGSDTIQCSSCGTTLTRTEYDQLCLVQANQKGTKKL